MADSADRSSANRGADGVWRTSVHTSMLYFYGMLGLCSKSLAEGRDEDPGSRAGPQPSPPKAERQHWDRRS